MDGIGIALMAAGSIISTLLIIILCIISIFFIRSRRSRKITNIEDHPSSDKPTDKEIRVEVNNNDNKPTAEVISSSEETTEAPKRTCMACRPTEIRLPCIRTLREEFNNIGNTEMQKKEFVRRLEGRRDDDVFDWIDREFEVLNRGFISERKSVAQSFNNMKKNRFMDVLPYDDNRVKIENHHHDYINASFIDGYDAPNSYIATQGPIGHNETNQGKRESTVEDFWVMLWEQSVHCVVMLTECVENLRLKCAQYWPEDVGDTCDYGKISVELMSTTSDDSGMLTQRQMNVTYEGHSRVVTQWHYKQWQDCKGPQNARHLIDFIRTVRRSAPPAPVLVHCSAGVGRTGVFIALDILLQHIKHHSSVDIFGCVKKLREQRVRMVQTVEQYITLYETVGLAIRQSEKSMHSPASRTSLNEYMSGTPMTQIAINA